MACSNMDLVTAASTSPFHLALCLAHCASCSSATATTSRCRWAAYRTVWRCCSSGGSSTSRRRRVTFLSLTHLFLGHNWNHQLLPDVLPASLRGLRLSDEYSQLLLPGALPPQLLYLSLGHSFNQPVSPGSILCHSASTQQVVRPTAAAWRHTGQGGDTAIRSAFQPASAGRPSA